MVRLKLVTDQFLQDLWLLGGLSVLGVLPKQVVIAMQAGFGREVAKLVQVTRGVVKQGQGLIFIAKENSLCFSKYF